MKRSLVAAAVVALCVCLAPFLPSCSRAQAAPSLMVPAEAVSSTVLAGSNDPFCKLTGCTMTGDIRARSFTATAASGAIAWTQNTGSFMCMNGATCTGAIRAGNPIRMTALSPDGDNGYDLGGPALQWRHFYLGGSVVSSANAAGAVQVSGTGWVEIAGDTAANVATRVPTAGGGGLIYDDTNTCFRLYQSGAWAGGCVLSGSGAASGTTVTAPLSAATTPGNVTAILWHGYTTGGATAESTNFRGSGLKGSSSTSAQYFTNAACNWSAAGVGGTQVVVRIQDVTSGAPVARCNVGACTQATTAIAVGSCVNADAGATLPALGNDAYAIQLDSTTDCGTNPSDVSCNINIGPK